MNLIGPDQKAAFEKSVIGLRNANTPSDYMGTNRAVVTLVGNQCSSAVVRGFTLIQDEPVSVAGGGRGPTPTDYFVSSIGTCENVVFARYAASEGIPIDSLETTVSGSWDRRGLYGIGDADPSFKEIVVETRVGTTASAEKVLRVAKLTHERCPIYATLKKATSLTFTLYVNAEPVPL